MTEVEADEMYQNAGEKGIPHLDPDDPPRRRANKRVGHGTMENDRPPVVGIVGRQIGRGPTGGRGACGSGDTGGIREVERRLRVRRCIPMSGMGTTISPRWDVARDGVSHSGSEGVGS